MKITNKIHCITCNKSKGKTIPLQTWTGPEGSRSLRLPDFKAIGIDRILPAADGTDIH
jgi:hypothetical protein